MRFRQKRTAGVKRKMNQEAAAETQELTWAEEHPWLAQIVTMDDEDSVDEVIRYTLDEIRFA